MMRIISEGSHIEPYNIAYKYMYMDYIYNYICLYVYIVISADREHIGTLNLFPYNMKAI